jgi:hypothetical protein
MSGGTEVGKLDGDYFTVRVADGAVQAAADGNAFAEPMTPLRSGHTSPVLAGCP